jgi:hypothetical protein
MPVIWPTFVPATCDCALRKCATHLEQIEGEIGGPAAAPTSGDGSWLIIYGYYCLHRFSCQCFEDKAQSLRIMNDAQAQYVFLHAHSIQWYTRTFVRYRKRTMNFNYFRCLHRVLVVALCQEVIDVLRTWYAICKE